MGCYYKSTISPLLSGGQYGIAGLFQAAPCGWVMGIVKHSHIMQSSGKYGVCNGVGGEGKETSPTSSFLS